jgi:hypothetical protein
MHDNPARYLGRFDPVGREPGDREFPFNKSAPGAPEREIPAVIQTLKDRLEHLLKTSEHLRERLGPALCAHPESNATELAGGCAITHIGSELQFAVQLANNVASVLADTIDRLQL